MYEGLAIVALLTLGLEKLGSYTPKVKSKFKIGDEVKLTAGADLTFHGYVGVTAIIEGITGRIHEGKVPLIALSCALCSTSGSSNSVSEKYLELVPQILDLTNIQ